MPKLSEIDPLDIQVVKDEPQKAEAKDLPTSGKLSDIDPLDIQVVSDKAETSVEETPEGEPGLLPRSMGEAADRLGAGLTAAKDTLLNPLSILPKAGNQLGKELADPRAGQAVGLHSGQGATLGGSDEGAAALTAATGGDYKSKRDQMRRDIDETARDLPLLSVLSEIGGGLPIALATGGASVGRPLLGAAINTGLAGAYGLGTSKKNSLGEAVSDTATAAALGAGLSGLANAKVIKNTVKNNYKTYFNPELGKDVIDTVNVNNIPVVKPVKNGALEIQFPGEGKKLKTAFKFGVDEARSFSSPEAQAKITDKVTHLFGNEEVEGAFPKIIAETQADLGGARKKIISTIGSKPIKTGNVFNDIIDDTAKITTGGVSDIAPAKIAFSDEVITPMWQKFQKASGSQNLDDVPLSIILEEKQALGDQLFGDKQLYRKAKEVRTQAVKLYNKLDGLLTEAHPDLKQYNDAFNATYRMKNNFIKSYSKLVNLSDPNAGTARGSYDKLIASFQKLDPNMRAAFLPKIQNFFSKEMPATLLLSDIKNAAVKATKSEGIREWVANKLLFNPGSRYNNASRVGAVIGKGLNAAQGTANLGKGAASLAGDALVGGDNSILGQAARVPSLTGAISIGGQRRDER